MLNITAKNDDNLKMSFKLKCEFVYFRLGTNLETKSIVED